MKKSTQEIVRRTRGRDTDWAATASLDDMAAQAAAHGYTLTSNLSAEWQHKLHLLYQAYSALKESVYDALVVQQMEAANDEMMFEIRGMACFS